MHFYGLGQSSPPLFFISDTPALCRLQASYAPATPSSPRAEPAVVRRAALVRSYELACAAVSLEPLTKPVVGKTVLAVFAGLKTKRLGPRGGSLAHCECPATSLP